MPGTIFAWIFGYANVFPEPTVWTPQRFQFLRRPVANKVPAVTLYFWIIKVLCTTVGESAADFLNYNLNWGLAATSVCTGVLFVILLAVQLTLPRYVAAVYWLTVVLVSVFGTLLTDNLTDHLEVPLETSTIAFSVLLGLVFASWYGSEGTLSIHSIFSRRRECFYWFAILVTFALGTASGDLVSEGLGVGYLDTGLLCAGLIGLIVLAWRLGLDAVLSFWLAYILTRPLGASLGDLLAQPPNHGGLGLGVGLTSAIFFSAIFGTILYLTLRKPDVLPETVALESRGSAKIQLVVVLLLSLIVSGGAYRWRSHALDQQVVPALPLIPSAVPVAGPVAGPVPALPPGPLGDLSPFVTITQDTLTTLEAGQQVQATTRIGDLEYAWDQAESTLKRRDPIRWKALDRKIDDALRELRATRPNVAGEKQSLTALLEEMQPVAGP